MTPEMKSRKLRAQKQDLIRTAIRDAAIELFATKGFDDTTVEQIAQAAGVSRRSYFRYFESKDDLLAQNVVDYGKVLAATVKSCPSSMKPLQVMRQTVIAGVEHNLRSEIQTREIIEISLRSASARQAHQSRMIDVEEWLAQAFAGRLKGGKKDRMKSRLLAGMTLALMHSALTSWFFGETRDLKVAVEEVFNLLSLTLYELQAANESGTKQVKGPRGRRSRSVSGVKA